jgi:lathosterol oxidase
VNTNILTKPFESIETFSWTYLFAFLMAYMIIRSLLIQGSLYLTVTRAECAKKGRIFKLPFGAGQLKSEFIATINTIIIDSILFAALVKLGPNNNIPGNIIFSYLFAFIWFEIWFYVSHRAFHSPALYWIHKQHHVAKVTSPLTAMSFSIIERVIVITGGVGFLTIVSAFLPLSRNGVTLYLLTNYALNLYGHSNVEIIPPRFLKNPLGRILNASTYHALHHARYNGHYGLFTPFMDTFLKSDFNDYLEVQSKAYQGDGLTSLGQRIKT